MGTVLLALGSAALFGISDFVGGVVSRRTSVWALAVVTQATALVIVGIAAVLLGGSPRGQDWWWGAAAGLGTGTGSAFLYRGLASGRMGVVAPISAVGAAVLPVVVGLVTGERPPLLAWIGIACAIPAIWLVSTDTDPNRVDGVVPGGRFDRGVVDGILAGLGFGVMFSALGQVPDAAGLGPLAATEASAILTIVALALVMRERWVPRDRAAIGGGAVAGGLAAGATVLFLFASQSGLLAVASVLSSLYPAVTVLLAATVLRERIGGIQALGLGLALAAVGLVAAG